MFIEILDLNRGRTLLNVNNIIYINEDVENNRVILSIVDSLLITNEPYEKIMEKINEKYTEKTTSETPETSQLPLKSNKKYKVKLLSRPEKYLKTIAYIRSILDIKLKTAKELVDNAPTIIAEFDDMEDAVKFQKLLNNCDAETSIIEE